MVSALGQSEARYIRRILELNAHLDPSPLKPWPHHGIASGASFALRKSDYAAIGGLPTPACGEDRALAARVERLGGSVRYADGPPVSVSLRTDGRARGGMADTLRRRMFDLDAPCDEIAEPPANAVLRAINRRGLRRAWPDSLMVEQCLRNLDLDSDDRAMVVAQSTFGAAWQEAEQRSARLRRVPLRSSELGHAENALCAILRALRRGENRC
jgi:hypothetical protein